MMNEVNGNKEQTQLKVWVPKDLKKDFQLHCLETDTNMTVEIVTLLEQYLEGKKITARQQ